MTNFDTSAIEDRIAAAMRRDQFWLRRQLKDFANGKEDVAKIARFHERLEESVALCEQRAQSIPKIQYPEELPVSAHRDTIIELIQNHQVIIVCGETGSGKSTQLPKLCLDAGLGRSGIIGHTQPRRIAARSISTRVAEELGSRVGEMVGYKIRFADQTSPTSLIKLMTDGILLAETQSDRFLEQYDAIILDEAHERSLNIDFLLGIFRRILQQRRDLRLIITSATIDADRFAEHFGNEHGPAPILNVEGRSYPVETRYLPASEVTNTEDGREPGLSQHIAAGLDEVFADGEGDSLVFLPTERDIREVTRHLGGHLRRRGLEKRCDILPLYARLPASEQQKIFQGSNRRRIVLATNVAESSLTVPGIRYVIDSGTARISRYSPRSKVQRLPIEDVSRASADQRAGRCGRVGPGVCIRLYSKADYEERDEFTTPEIRRTNLASVILQTKVLKLGSVDEFPFLDAPRPESIREGYRTLHEIGAIDERNELTRIGRTLGSMPVDPRVGRMIIEADERGCLPEILVIAAALEIQDPRQRPPDRKQAADEAHAKFVDGRSDFLSYLRLWRFYRNLHEDLSRNRLGKACQRNFLSLNRLREWADVHRQLKGLVSDIRKRQSDRPRRKGKNKAPDDKSPSNEADRSLSDLRIHEASEPDEATVDDGLYASIHQSLLSGLLSGVALAGEKHEYTGIGGLQFFLWPGSGVFATKPKWIVAGELLETAKRYGRNVARIDPNWLEPLASHLVKRSYADPFWSGKAQSAFCYERVTLFGLPIVIKRRKALAPIDPETARRMLIDHGLCEGELHSKARFFQHNQRLRELIAKLADKTRKREFVVDDYLVEHFYHGRLPGDVIDRITLEKFDRTHPEPKWASQCSTEAGLLEWIDKPSDGGDSESLYLSPSDLLPNMVESLDPNEFPESLQVGPTALPLSYQFDPSADDDGVTVTIPKVVLAQVSEDRLGWLVPGLIHDKIVGLIKALPKRIRRNLVPAADTATSVIEELGEDLGKTPFMPTICEQLSKRAEMQITAMDFEPSKMSESLGFYIRVLDDDGKTVAEGRDIRELRDEVGVASSPSAAADSSVVEMSDDDLHQDGLKDFTIEQLPKQVTRDRGGVRVALFPSFVDQQTSVAVRLLDNAEVSEVQTRRGLIRLYALAQHREISKQVKWLPGLNDAAVLLSPVIASDELKQGLSAFIANMAFVNREPIVRTKDAFQARLSNRGERIAMASQDASRVLLPMAEAYQKVRLSMGELKVGHLAYARDDIKAQLAGLFCEDFLISTDVEALKHYPRYLKAIAMRLDKIRSAGDKDREGFDIVNGFQLDYAHRSQDRSKASPVLEEYRWMIEELRVSVFAQSLGTAGKVSPQRLDKLRIKLERQV